MTTQQKLIKSKLNLLELGSYLGNVSEAYRTLGCSRDTFYRLKKQSLVRQNHHRWNVLNGRSSDSIWIVLADAVLSSQMS